MEQTICTPVKINLTLRIFSRRCDGYHDIYSVFSQKKSIEQLTIKANCAEITNDILDVSGMEISGENLVTKALKCARHFCAAIPPMEITLRKYFPAGSGIGAGSGDAAALLKWLKKTYSIAIPESAVARLGADVAFLASDYGAAYAQGAGEVLTPADAPDVAWALAFPAWSSATKEAYAKLDALRERGICAPVTPDEAQREARDILRKLCAKERAGRLPNDFWDVLVREHAEYRAVEHIASGAGALAWGLCGSGSAVFALCADEHTARDAAESFGSQKWITKTTILG